MCRVDEQQLHIQKFHRLNFVEVRESFLDRYIQIKSTQVEHTQPFRKPFKAVSTTANETCLFPDEMPLDLCKKIGFCFCFGSDNAENDTVSRGYTA